MSGSAQRVLLLVVKGKPGDIRLVRDGLASSSALEAAIATDRLEAMPYLRREGRYASASRPHLILLDLDLPKQNGREALAEIKAAADLRSIPVIVLKTSDADLEIRRCCELTANSFIRKPGDCGRFVDTLRSIERCRLTTASLPSAVSASHGGPPM